MKKIMILGAFVLLIGVGLCGCIETLFTSDNQYVQISNVKVTTEWTDWNKEVRDGFDHSYPESKYVQVYIRGEIKNIAGKIIDSVRLICIFYDNKGNSLCQEDVTISNLYIDEINDFTIRTSNDSLSGCDFFDYIVDYKITISNVNFKG